MAEMPVEMYFPKVPAAGDKKAQDILQYGIVNYKRPKAELAGMFLCTTSGADVLKNADNRHGLDVDATKKIGFIADLAHPNIWFIKGTMDVLREIIAEDHFAGESHHVWFDPEDAVFDLEPKDLRNCSLDYYDSGRTDHVELPIVGNAGPVGRSPNKK